MKPCAWFCIPFIFVITACAVLAQDPPKPTTSASPDLPEPVAIARIRTARTSVESYAKILKARHKTAVSAFDEAKKAHKPDSEAFKEAEKKFAAETKIIDTAQQKYIAAYSAYDGWLAALKTGIASGKSKQLAKDENYKTVAADASKAAAEFVNFATPHISANQRGTRGFITVLGSLAKLGVDVWQAYTKGKAERAKEYAEYVGTQVQWREWDKL